MSVPYVKSVLQSTLLCFTVCTYVHIFSCNLDREEPVKLFTYSHLLVICWSIIPSYWKKWPTCMSYFEVCFCLWCGKKVHVKSKNSKRSMFWNLFFCHGLNGCQQPMKDMFANIHIHLSLRGTTTYLRIFITTRYNNLFTNFHVIYMYLSLSMWDNKVFLASLRFCDGISLFLISISPKNNMANSTASNSTQQLTIYTLSKIIYSSVSDLNV